MRTRIETLIAAFAIAAPWLACGGDCGGAEDTLSDDALRSAISVQVAASAQPASPKPGTEVEINLTITASRDTIVNIDLAVARPDGSSVYSASWAAQSLGRSSPLSFTEPVGVESTDPLGVYAVGVTVTRTGQTKPLFQNSKATTFTVVSACVPAACAAQGKNCGSVSDGCGGTLNCGVCTAPQTCGGGGTPNVCGSPSTGGQASFTPAPIPLSDPEIPNPMRGGYPLWGIMNPSNWPITDLYERFDWADFESAQGVYNWSWMESRLASAKAKGGKWGFRIMAGNSSRGGNSPAVPQYLAAMMPKGFWFTYPGNSYQTYAPDWNDPSFLSRVQALFQAISQKYGNDPRLGWIEIGIYGDWSEWHVWQWPYTDTAYGPSPTGAADMTSAHKRQIIQWHVDAFPAKQVVMPLDEAGETAWAITTYPKLGLRRDCLGYPDFINSHMAPYFPQIQNQWQTAPFITETCYIASGSGGFQRAADQVVQYHVSMVSGHNMQSYASLTPTEQSQLQQTYKSAGYRFVLDRLTMPARIAPGASFTTDASWLNVGSAPAYVPWDIVLLLKDNSGSAVWRGKSHLSLQTLLPTGATPAPISDAFSLPASLASGTYTVSLRVEDPAAYYAPLNLAIQGRRADGSYDLGQIAVGN